MIPTPSDLGITASELDAPFQSLQPDLTMLQQEHADPTIGSLLNPEAPQWGVLMQDDGMRLTKIMTAQSAVATGVPTELLGNIRAVIEAPTDPSVWIKMWTGALTMAVDIAIDVLDASLEGVGAVPIVGAIAKAIGKITLLIIRAAKKPPMFVAQQLAHYSKAANENYATMVKHAARALTSRGTPDWTRVFRPPFLAAWQRVKTRHSFDYGEWLYQVGGTEGPIDPKNADGLAIVPGMVRGVLGANFQLFSAMRAVRDKYGLADFYTLDSIPNTHFNVYPYYWLLDGSGRYGPDSRPDLVAEIIRNAVYDTSQTRINGVQAGAGLWNQVNTWTPAMFNVDASESGGLKKEWHDYIESGWSRAYEFIQSKAERRDIEQAHVDQWFALACMAYFYDVEPTADCWWAGHQKAGGGPSMSERKRIDNIAARHIDRLKLRQLDAMKTTLIASCSKKQRAFWNSTGGRSPLGDMLDEYRRRLLRSEWINTLRLEDIPDKDYRAAVSDYRRRGQGFQLTLVTSELKRGREKQSTWTTPWGGISPPLPFDDTPAPGSRPPLGVPWAVWGMGAAAALAYAYRDKLMRKFAKLR